MTDWIELSARASFDSHRLIGWIYWDPVAIEAYTQLGVENGFGYYIATRGGPLAPAGHQAVSAAFYSIHPGFVQISLEMAQAAATWQQVTDARDHGVAEGLRAHAPELCDELASLRDPLWEAADALSSSGRVLFAAHRQWPRPDDEALAVALDQLEARGLATDGVVNEAGLALRERVEARTNELSEKAWRLLGEDPTRKFIDLVEPFGQRFLDRIDATAGPNWMPAARDRRPSPEILRRGGRSPCG